MSYVLQIKLLSDTTFGRGDGLAGLLDQEVEQDAAGFPSLRGRTLKGLLSEACDGLVALGAVADQRRWNAALRRLFGSGGSTTDSAAVWHIGNAELPVAVRWPVMARLGAALRPSEVLEALTTIRRQTAIDPETGLPDPGSLRTMRVVLRGQVFFSRLEPADQTVADDDLALLAAGCVALRHVGAGRNRGRGRVACSLWHDQEDITDHYLQRFNDLLGERP